MCELMSATLALTAVTGAMSAYSSVQQGKQQAKAANYQAKVAANNARIADQNAREVEATGRAEEQRARISAGQKTAAMRAMAAGSGFDVGSDSFVDEFAASDVAGDYDARAIRNRYQAEANQHRQQAQNFASDVGLYNQASENAARGGYMDAAGSLLGTASRMTGMYASGGDPVWGKSNANGRDAIMKTPVKKY